MTDLKKSIVIYFSRADKNKIVYGSDYPHSPAKVVIAKKNHLDNNEKYKNC